MSQNAKARIDQDRLPQIIAERDRYQKWLEKLETERSEIPDHIYERISADYAERLQNAVEALSQHVDTIEERLEERRAALDEAQQTLSAKQDEMVEAEIRSRVGEFDERKWQSVEKSLKSAIDDAAKRRDELEAEIQRLQEAIEQIHSAAPAADSEDDATFLRALAEASGANGGNGKNGGGSESRNRVAVLEADTAREASPNRPRKPTGLRTLRCETCGTFNLPEAMFCEACGADLPGG